MVRESRWDGWEGKETIFKWEHGKESWNGRIGRLNARFILKNAQNARSPK